MSQESKKAPSLKVKPFTSPNSLRPKDDFDEFDRSLLYTEEATMITSINDLQDRRAMHTQITAPGQFPIEMPNEMHQDFNESDTSDSIEKVSFEFESTLLNPPKIKHVDTDPYIKEEHTTDRTQADQVQAVKQAPSYPSPSSYPSSLSYPPSSQKDQVSTHSISAITPPALSSKPSDESLPSPSLRSSNHLDPLSTVPLPSSEAPETSSNSSSSSLASDYVPNTSDELHYPPASDYPSSTPLPPSINEAVVTHDLPITADLDRSDIVEHEKASSHPQVIVFFNTRGGVGSTTLACNMAGNLHSFAFPSVVVDMDLQMSSVPSYLNCKLERSLAEFMTELSNQRASGTSPQITSAVDRHHDGLSIIAQDERIDEIAAITSDRLPLFYEALKKNYQYIIVDGLRSFSDHAVTVMDLADQIIIPVTQDVPSVRSAKRALNLFERLGYPKHKLTFILNRYHKKGLISLETIENVLNRDIDFFIPNQFNFVSQAISDGLMFKELTPNHKITQAVLNMSLTLAGQADLIPKRKNLFQRLFGR